MTDGLERLEKRIEELTKRLQRVEDKVFSGADEAPDPPAASSPIEDRRPAAPSTTRKRVHATTIISFVGRSLVVLGGAFLLRWLTQSGFLPHKMGSVIGVIYALVWIAMADIKAGHGQRYSAVFHGVTGAFIAFPLLVEATTKLHYLTPMLSAIHLAAFIILGLAVAGRRKLRSLAWIITLPAAPLAFVLAVKTEAMTPFLISLLLLGFVTLWLGYLRHWHVLATVMAGAANFGLALMVMDYVMASKRASVEQQAPLWEVLFLLFGLIALYFGSYCFRVFKRKRTITPLEIGQTLVVVLIGLGGAAMVIDASEHSMLPLGIVCLILSIAFYTAAYGLLPRRDPNRRNFLFYTLLALAMVIMGCEISFQPATTAIAFTAIALVAGALANGISSRILFLHGTAYLIAAIVRSGLLVSTVRGFAGPSVRFDEWMSVPLLFALIITALYPWFPRPQGRSIDMHLGRRSVDVFLFVTVLALGGLLVSLVAQLSPQGEDSETYRRVLACTRTGALALSATLLAWCSHRTRFRNLAWLVYTILVLGAFKLVLEDIAAGGAAGLFLSLGLYGGTLILAPRLLHRAANQKAEET
ncbi:MAG: hypothetical protein OEN01_09445 [Candidatus Krumholzibacteria bacterium]|nr:hypothetical protein [Candidatus Krumholzibacteria bacterium]